MHYSVTRDVLQTLGQLDEAGEQSKSRSWIKSIDHIYKKNEWCR
jgi:hypothetical protein